MRRRGSSCRSRGVKLAAALQIAPLTVQRKRQGADPQPFVAALLTRLV
jgi:hypothetical protein